MEWPPIFTVRGIGGILSSLSTIQSFDMGPTANRPPAGVAGRLWLATDAGVLYADSGTAWVPVTATSGMQTFTESGQFVVPAGVSALTVLLIGGGGGGGGGGASSTTTAGAGGGGGGGGASLSGIVPALPGQTLTVTVGTGGAGGAGGTGTTAGSNGANGGTSSIALGSTTYLMAGGGGGGGGGESQGTAGGNGGSSGTIYPPAAGALCLGNPYNWAGVSGSSSSVGGNGGMSYFGLVLEASGGAALNPGNPGNNASGVGGGGGGGGGATTAAAANGGAGGQGGNGLVIVKW